MGGKACENMMTVLEQSAEPLDLANEVLDDCPYLI